VIKSVHPGSDVSHVEFALAARPRRTSCLPADRWVEEQLQPIDDRYRALLLDEQMRPKVPWWEWRYPRYAGQQWPAELLSLYGLTIEVRD
jgi:hypothetical protein